MIVGVPGGLAREHELDHLPVGPSSWGTAKSVTSERLPAS